MVRARSNMTSPSIAPKEYAISVETNSIREAISQLGGSLYDLLEQVLMTSDEEDESDFSQFVRETFHVLARHPEHISGDSDAVQIETDSNDDEGSFLVE